MKLSVWAKHKGISLQTAYRWFHKGLIPNAVQIDTKTIIVNEHIPNSIDVNSNNSINNNILNSNKVFIYARVSSHNKKEDLVRQIDRCSQFAFNQGLSINKIYKEIASGMNDNRKHFWDMLNNNPNIIIIEHKDRLTRFGFNYIEKLLMKQNCKIIVINKDVVDENDLIKDMISIVTSFCCRLYGLRRGNSKSNKIKEIIDDKNESNIATNDIITNTEIPICEVDNVF